MRDHQAAAIQGSLTAAALPIQVMQDVEVITNESLLLRVSRHGD